MDDGIATYIAALRRAVPRPSPDQPRAANGAMSLRDGVLSPAVIGRASALIAAHTLQILFTIGSWVFIGAGALSGRVDRGWIVAWALCLATAAVFRMAAIWLEGVVSIAVSGAIRQCLLGGAMSIAPDVVRRRGPAELMAEVLEVDSIERVAEGGAFLALLSMVELILACAVLAWGASPAVQMPLLAASIGLVLWCGRRHLRMRAAWASMRVAQTEQMVERMIAHRTRAVQQPADAWHESEDGALAAYVDRSRELDRSTTGLEAALPRTYVVAALVALTPVFVEGSASTVEQAVTLGVILYSGRSLRSLTFGIPRLAGAFIAWRRVREIAAAAFTRDAEGVSACAGTAAAVLRAEGITFTHHGRTAAAVRECSLALRSGEFVLLEGESGSGKSTLASLLAGRRQPSAGAVMSCGLDIHTVGARAWRRRIGAVPSYHDNHVLSATFGFNLLLGRSWPHSAEDLADARQVCEELGLRPLLERMPSGLDQMIGETGWQLSHGERSRLFLARALLQRPAVLLLDETFAALDPENLRDCLQCVFRRADAAVVIAHP